MSRKVKRSLGMPVRVLRVDVEDRWFGGISCPNDEHPLAIRPELFPASRITGRLDPGLQPELQQDDQDKRIPFEEHMHFPTLFFPSIFELRIFSLPSLAGELSKKGEFF